MKFGEPFGGLFPGARGAVLSVLLRTGATLTGRQVHAMVRDGHSLWSVQQALADLISLGLIESTPVGRANLYTLNEQHYAITPLRALLDPLGALREVAAGAGAESVILFGSLARGEATVSSDIDLAVLAGEDWDGRAELEDSVRARLGNDCDVVVFTPERFQRLAISGEEPVVAEILADGVALVGAIPRPGTRVA